MCVVKGPAQAAMAKIKKVDERGKVSALPQKKEPKAQAKSEDQHTARPYFEPAYDLPFVNITSIQYNIRQYDSIVHVCILVYH